MKLKGILKKKELSTLSVYSGHTAFFMVLSFFPFMMFFFSLLRLTSITEADFINWAKPIVPQTFQKVMESLTHEVYAGSTTQLVSITIIIAIFLSSTAFVSLQQGLNHMYQIKETRNVLLLRIYGMLYSVAFAFCLLAMLVLLGFGNWIFQQFVSVFPWLEKVMQYRMVFSIPVLLFFFWLLYVFVPNRKQKKLKQIPGAVFAAGGWFLFSSLFSIYVDHFSKYSSIYGALTTIVLIMVWLYWCMYVVFLGGFLNHVIANGS